MKMKTFVFSILAAGFSHAGVVIGTNINRGVGDTLLADASGGLLSGTIASVGYFTAGFDWNSAVATNDFASLNANFVSLTFALTGDTSSAFGSDIAGFFETPSHNYGAPGQLLGTSLFVFFGDAATLDASTAFALIAFDETIDSDTPLPDSNTLQLSTSDSSRYTVLIGGQGSVSVDLSAIGEGTVVNPIITLIPEPSVALLGAVGAIGLLRRRR